MTTLLPSQPETLAVLPKSGSHRRDFYDRRAAFRPHECERHYHTLLKRYYAFLVPPGARVLEIGCGIGDLLAAVNPSRGLGIDFSQEMINIARRRHSDLEFQVADAAGLLLDETFDFILLSDLVNDLPDVQSVLSNLRHAAHERTRLVINFFNHLWHPMLAIAEKAGLKAPTLLQNWLSTADMKNLLLLSGWEVIKTDARILWPVRTPLIQPLLNRWLAPFSRHLCLAIFIVARLAR